MAMDQQYTDCVRELECALKLLEEVRDSRDEYRAQRDEARRAYEVMSKLREGAEQERDAMAAQNAALRTHGSRLRDHWDLKNTIGAETRRQVIAWDELEAEPPETSLAKLKAQWQAEALEAEVENGDYGMFARDRLTKGAQFYREQTQEAT